MDYERLLLKLAPVIAHIGQPEFGQHYGRFMNEQFAVSQCSVLAFKRNGKPVPLVVESLLHRDLFALSSRHYTEEGYRHDASLAGSANQDITIIQMLPSDWPNEVCKALQAEEIGCELLFCAPQPSVVFAGVLQRSDEHQPFNVEEIAIIRQVFVTMREIFHKHLQFTPENEQSSIPGGHDSRKRHDALIEHFRLYLLKNESRLSAREIDICAHIIVGIASEGIAYRLNISRATVVTHRRNLYRKLNISSQSELFTRYFQKVFMDKETMN